MDFKDQVQSALEKAMQEKLPQVIEAEAEKLVKDVIEDMFRWGDIKKDLKKKIEESLDVNLQKFDLIDYNALVAKTINENLVKQVNLQPIIDMTKNMTGFINKTEISLQEIADIFIEASMEENESEGEGAISFHVLKSDRDYWNIYADVEPDKSERDCSLSFCISKDGKIFYFRSRDEYWDSFRKAMKATRLLLLDNILHKVFRLYSAGVTVTKVDSPIDTSWYRY